MPNVDVISDKFNAVWICRAINNDNYAQSVNINSWLSQSGPDFSLRNLRFSSRWIHVRIVISRDIWAGFSPNVFDVPLLIYCSNAQLWPPLQVCGSPDSAEQYRLLVLLDALSLTQHFAGYRVKVFIYLLEGTQLLLFLPGTGWSFRHGSWRNVRCMY